MKLSPEQLKDYIESGVCPWCSKDGLRILGCHSSLSHGIYARDIRVMLKVIKKYPVCTREASEEKRLVSQKTGLAEIGRTLGGRKPGGVTEMSEAGIIGRRRNVAKLHIDRTTRHNCPACGKEIIGYRPLYCSPSCRNSTRINNLRKIKVGIL